MKKNVGKTDRVVRIILAIILAVLSYSGVVTGTVATVFLVLAAVFVITAVLSFCPIYAIVGLSTCKTSAAR